MEKLCRRPPLQSTTISAVLKTPPTLSVAVSNLFLSLPCHVRCPFSLAQGREAIVEDDGPRMMKLGMGSFKVASKEARQAAGDLGCRGCGS
ncbi:hypothetical protein NL676_009185 [Syzygium grande]|nr:hypothetical protein NL676_009185 [Syzygium grande]